MHFIFRTSLIKSTKYQLQPWNSIPRVQWKHETGTSVVQGFFVLTLAAIRIFLKFFFFFFISSSFSFSYYYSFQICDVTCNLPSKLSNAPSKSILKYATWCGLVRELCRSHQTELGKLLGVLLSRFLVQNWSSAIHISKPCFITPSTIFFAFEWTFTHIVIYLSPAWDNKTRNVRAWRQPGQTDQKTDRQEKTTGSDSIGRHEVEQRAGIRPFYPKKKSLKVSIVVEVH